MHAVNDLAAMLRLQAETGQRSGERSAFAIGTSIAFIPPFVCLISPSPSTEPAASSF